MIRTLLFALLYSPMLLAQPRWELMDYGPFLSSSVTMPWSVGGEKPEGITLKGITLKLGTNAAICFDTDLCRYSGGWTGGWLQLMGTPFDGTHRPPQGSRPAVNGKLAFHSLVGPGTSSSGQWTDPRPEPYGPLPKAWAKYTGLYVHGDRVTLAYTVGDCAVLDLPGFVDDPLGPIFLRTLTYGPCNKPIEILICSADDPVQVKTQGGPSNVIVTKTDGRVVLRLPEVTKPSTITVAIGATLPEDLSRLKPVGARLIGEKDLSAGSSKPSIESPGLYTKNFPTRFAQKVQTKGTLGNKGGAYEVDLLTAPDKNPWNSWMRFGGFDFFADGTRAAVCTWNGDVWVVSGIDESLQNLSWQRVATGLFQPLGLKIVKDQVYVLGRDQITRLQDLNGDGEADFYKAFNNDLTATPNFHEFVMDLQTDPEGNFYFTKGAPLLGTDYFDPISAHNGCVLQVSPDGQTLKTYATGLRAPNGAGVGPQGQVTCSDNEGIWTPVCRLNWVKPGGFYGTLGTAHRIPAPTDYDKPLCWFPFAVDNSSGGQVWVTSKRWGPFEGEMLHMSYGKCTLFHVLKDEVDGQVQGGVVQFPLKFESSAMRGRFNSRDGQLYVAGLKGWQTTAVRDGALHRVRYTGKPFASVKSMHVRPGGLEITLTMPVEKGSALDLQNYNLQHWNYKWSEKYGSDLYSVRDPSKIIGKKGDLKGEAVGLASVDLSPDGHKLFLHIPTLTPAMQMLTQFNLKLAQGGDLPVEIYHTINRIPTKKE